MRVEEGQSIKSGKPKKKDTFGFKTLKKDTDRNLLEVNASILKENKKKTRIIDEVAQATKVQSGSFQIKEDTNPILPYQEYTDVSTVPIVASKLDERHKRSQPDL